MAVYGFSSQSALFQQHVRQISAAGVQKSRTGWPGLRILSARTIS
jgi:hypothetical protein